MSQQPIFVYVAGPLTQGDMFQNTRDAINMADRLLTHGYYPYCPHLASFWHMFAEHHYETWMDLDFKWLEKCDVLLRLPGHSPGADREVAHAQQQSIPVVHSFHELVDLTKKGLWFTSNPITGAHYDRAQADKS